METAPNSFSYWQLQCNQRLQDDIKEAIKEADAEYAAYEQFLASDVAASLDEATIVRMDAEIAQVRIVLGWVTKMDSPADQASCSVAAVRRGWQLRAEEERLLAELSKVSEEQGELQHVAAELDEEAREVRELEEQYARRRIVLLARRQRRLSARVGAHRVGPRCRYWRDLNAFQDEQQAFQSERDSLLLKHAYATEQLNRLRKTSVYDEVFRIWHDGHFGTINNCRLGREPGHMVRFPPTRVLRISR